MKYIIGGIIIYIILLTIITILLYKNGDPNKVNITDEEYNDFIKDIEKQKSDKKKKKI